MSDLISRKALLEALKDNGTYLLPDGADESDYIYYSEAVDLITNAPVVEQGEPVGSIFRICTNRHGEHFLDVAVDKSKVKDGDKLYTAPPQPQTVKDALEKAAVTTWSYLMDYCKKKGKNPAHDNDLFEVVNEIRALIEKG